MAFPCAQAIEEFGLEARRNSRCASLKDDALGFVEFHIEQGPVLEELGLSARRGRSHRRAEQARIHVCRAAPIMPAPRRCICVAMRSPPPRSGSLPWSKKRSAFRASWRRSGKLQAKPGATNVIAGEARLHSRRAPRFGRSSDARRGNVDRACAKKLRSGAGCDRPACERSLNQKAVAMDPFLVGQVEEAIRARGLRAASRWSAARAMTP